MLSESMLQSRESANLKDLEAKFNALERVNFDLKMQLFYLNENKQSNIDGLDSKTTSSDDSEDEEDKNIEILLLKDENDILKRKVEELESDLQTLQIAKEKEAEKFQRTLKGKAVSNYNLTILEENHRREREAAIAIAERDSALISKLQQDILKLQSQHDDDVEALSASQAKMNEKSSLLIEKEEVIMKLTAFNSSMKQQLDILTEKSKYHELLIRSNGWSGSSPSKENRVSDSNSSSSSSQATISSMRTEIENLKSENENIRRSQHFESEQVNLERQRVSQLQQELDQRAIDVKTLTDSIDQYKQRESEMLYALEGVIGRCQELEAAAAHSRS
eukprot:gene31597-41027_t